jgi:hypothetical protein
VTHAIRVLRTQEGAQHSTLRLVHYLYLNPPAPRLARHAGAAFSLLPNRNSRRYRRVSPHFARNAHSPKIEHLDELLAGQPRKSVEISGKHLRIPIGNIRRIAHWIRAVDWCEV